MPLYTRKPIDYYELHSRLMTVLGAKFLGLQGTRYEIRGLITAEGQELTPTELSEAEKILGFPLQKEKPP